MYNKLNHWKILTYAILILLVSGCLVTNLKEGDLFKQKTSEPPIDKSLVYIIRPYGLG
ncbi:MAG: hypothetical protein R2771_02250 [Saprospiraceae bacterium]